MKSKGTECEFGPKFKYNKLNQPLKIFKSK